MVTLATPVYCGVRLKASSVVRPLIATIVPPIRRR
jgi:hypothetical protein